MKKQLTKIGMLVILLSTSLKVQAQSPSMFVTCEGNFSSGNGSVSLFDIGSSSVENDYYFNETANQLGDVVQSMEFYDGNAYFVVNGSAKVERLQVWSGTTYTIIGFSSPRYAKYHANKLYVTDWYSNSLQVVNLATNSIVNSIPVGLGPETLLITNGKAYVTNLGGYGLDSTVSVVDLYTETVIETITVGDRPSSIVSVNGKVWVLCEGYTEYDSLWNVVSETPGKLVKINPTTDVVESTFTFTVGDHPEDLIVGGNFDKLYFSNGSWSKSVYEMDVTSTTLPITPFINRSFYGLGYDWTSNQLYAADAVDYVQNGWVFRYANTGAVVDSFQVGIIPGSFYFWQPILGMETVSTADVSVYPNPSNGRFFINSSEEIVSVRIRNILGEEVLFAEPSAMSDVINISDQTSGIFIIEVRTKSGVSTQKLIVE